MLLTLVITEPVATPTAGLMTRMVVQDEHGCEVAWYSLDTAGHGYGPYAEHPERAVFGWPRGLGLDFAFSNGVDEGWACPSADDGLMAALYEAAVRLEGGWDCTVECDGEAPFPSNTLREPGDRYVDGGWEDAAGYPIPETTSSSCNRTCLECQSGRHPGCGMGCHDQQILDHAAGEHDVVPVEHCPSCEDDEVALDAHEAAHEAGSATLARRDGCEACDEVAAQIQAALGRTAQSSTSDRQAPRTAIVELQCLADRFVTYRVRVLVADDLGFVTERHVWGGAERIEGERMVEVARKSLGAVNGLTVVAR